MDLVLTQEVLYLLKNYGWNMKIPFKMVPFGSHVGFWGSQQQWQMKSTCPPIFSYRSCAVPVAVIISSYWTWIFSQCLQAWQQATNMGNHTNLGVAPLSKRLVTGEGAHLVWFGMENPRTTKNICPSEDLLWDFLLKMWCHPGDDLYLEGGRPNGDFITS